MRRRSERGEKNLTTVFKTDDEIDDFFRLLYEQDWSVEKVCKELEIRKASLYDLVKLPKYKHYMEMATEVAKLVAFAKFMEGVSVADLNVRMKFISKLPESVLLNFFGLDVSNKSENQETSNSIEINL